MNILVTGSEGYLGTPLIQKLLKEGYTVVGLDTGFYSQANFYKSKLKPYKLIKKDIRQIETIDLKGIEAVIHLAELSNDPLGENDPKLTFDINHRGTVRLINKAIEAGISRFIYFSSCSVYGYSPEIITEKSKTNPLTAYAKSKILNEGYLLKNASNNFHPIILRNSTVFGPSVRMRFDLVINSLVGSAVVFKQIRLNSDGAAWRPFVHIEDIGNAVIAVLKAHISIVDREIFNVGSNENNYQVVKIAQSIKKYLPKCSVSFNLESKDKRNYNVNFDKIHAKLPNFKTQTNVDTGIKELIDLFKSLPLSPSMFDSRLYTRLKQIKYLKENSKINNDFYWI